MKNSTKKYRKWPIISGVVLLIYFIWGHFGFAGIRIPGKYEADKKSYSFFWQKKSFKSSNGYVKIKFYTPFPKHGLIDSTGKLSVPFLYDNLNDVNDDGFVLVLNNGNRGIVTAQNKSIAEPKFYDVQFLPHHYISLIKIINGEKIYNLIDINGKEILPLEYNSIFFLSDDSAKPFIIAEKRNVSYFIFVDNNKQVKQNFIAVDYSVSKNNVVLIKGFLSQDLIPDHKYMFSHYNSSFPPYYKARLNKTDYAYHYSGLFNIRGEELLPLEYDLISQLKNVNLYEVGKNHKKGLYSGAYEKWIFKPKEVEIEVLSEDLPLIEIKFPDGKKQYIDEQGIILLSSKIQILEIDRKKILFRSKNQKYSMTYNNENQKFTWRKT